MYHDGRLYKSIRVYSDYSIRTASYSTVSFDHSEIAQKARPREISEIATPDDDNPRPVHLHIDGIHGFLHGCATSCEPLPQVMPGIVGWVVQQRQRLEDALDGQASQVHAEHLVAVRDGALRLGDPFKRSIVKHP